MKCDAWVGMLSWWSCQSPVAHGYSLLNHPNTFHRGMFKLNAKFDADSLLYSVILNETATRYTCSLNGIYHPHWLVQWSHHCSCVRIPVHSPWLLGYIELAQTVIILTTAGLSPDRPRILYTSHVTGNVTEYRIPGGRIQVTILRFWRIFQLLDLSNTT